VQWSLLGPLSAQERAQVLRTAHSRTFPRGHVVCREGDPADALHLVESGRLSVRVSTPDGDGAMLNVLGAGDYFGEVALLRPEWPMPRTATVTTLEPTRTLAIAHEEFTAIRARNPGVEQMLTWLLADRVQQLTRRLLDALYLSVDARVELRLTELVDLYGGAGHAGAVAVPLTQEQLAELAGATRPTVNQVLRRLEDKGVVTLGRGSIRVLDPARLNDRAG
jgi:CRP/FNR family transcriptional regulator, cyclic AMP receptor protein